MKSRLLLAMLTGAAFICHAAAAASSGGHAQSIDQFAWHQRVLVVFADNAGSAPLAAQRNILANASDVMSERDLVLVEVVGHTVKGATESADALRHRYNVKPDAFRALLIGKDGGVKLDSPSPILLKTLASTIDSMPMRKQEMNGS
jgi:hypothetical protein